jgi:hypothetical protein
MPGWVNTTSLRVSPPSHPSGLLFTDAATGRIGPRTEFTFRSVPPGASGHNAAERRQAQPDALFCR